jgi:pSer/pThr/pTyr-binding forkhead associated (FHA) protein
MKAELTFTEGPRAGEKILLAKLGSFTIGRQDDNNLAIDEKAVSRRHCRIDYDGDLFWLVDCGSHNGTRVNGELVRRSRLESGDLIQVGHTELEFSLVQNEFQDDFFVR